MAMATALDDLVGQVVNGLEENELYNNTVIIFSSDNGGLKGTNGNTPLRGAKDSIYEGGTRVPTFVHSPLLQQTG